MQRSRRSSSLANAPAELKPCQVIRDTPQNNLRRPEYFSDFFKICKMSADEERIWLECRISYSINSAFVDLCKRVLRRTGNTLGGRAGALPRLYHPVNAHTKSGGVPREGFRAGDRQRYTNPPV